MGKITHERLLELLSYDPLTGIFTRRIGVRGHEAGSVVGTVKDGYVCITLDKKFYLAHRLAWFYMTGSWPLRQIDHKDRDRSNNRWLNLRLATNQQNTVNRDLNSNNTSGSKGVSYDKARGKWRAQISIGGSRTLIGRFDLKSVAEAAYRAEALKHFGEFAEEIA
ncbi:hypothetical protein B9J07_28095 [Sinorhizobium sp. LM21]|uniref:HNH endonuclease n=1 Tax=Sinorhizobium sp. LM21 TaxID=1449788 RepID=UPI0005D8E8B1|nr:HNH endonuclease [Sinorhizobium sp. LM21]AJW30146.1 HNH endonuclease [Sinorhizobium sp. LM21]OWZ90449.1 hypothetical protein B9J07_28095 [Sinorhizobium sp. LM21]